MEITKNKIKIETVSHNQASKLDQLGFDDACLQYYTGKKELKGTNSMINGTPDTIDFFTPKIDIWAPKIIYALQWLREIKQISVNCSMTTGGAVKYTVMEWKNPGEGWDTLVANNAGSFSEAESQGLDWTLDYLIKQIK